jgi:hypothetical protein
MQPYDRVPVGYVFVEIITESETYHIYKTVLLTIKVAARNLSGAATHNLSTT